jgi:SAM-dependent methyltransferase
MQRPTLDKFPKSVLGQIDIQKAFIISRLIISAERLQVFRALHGKGQSADAIGRTVKIHKLYLHPFLNALTAVGLLRRAKDTYWLTPFARKYFIDERSIYWTRQYSKECADDYEALTLLEQVLTSGKTPDEIKGVKKPDYLERMKRDRREAEDFTQMLFHFHQPDAKALAEYLDLSQHQAVLDVAGGSGVMSIALAKKNPHLKACVLDIAPVCEVAARNIRQAGLSGRIRTMAGDILQPLPAGFDVIMLCDIGDVPPQLLKNAYKVLPRKGRVVLVDRYFSDDGIKPLDRLLEYFLGGSFGLATRRDMVEAVKSCGFRAVKAQKTYADVWVITGDKPGGSQPKYSSIGRILC